MNEISFKLPNSHQKMKRLVYLDSLRGFAAVWVVFYHMIFLAKPNLQTPDWLSFLRVGGMGVTIFYIISSFSLCLTMPRHISTGKYLKSFYIHRAFRILPLFYVVLLASVYFFLNRGVKYDLLNIYANVFCIFNMVPGWQQSIVMAGWTIGVEVIVYIIFPFLYKYSKNLLMSVVIFGISLLVSWFAREILPQEYYKLFFIRHLPIFAGGMIIFKLRQFMPGRKKIQFAVGLILFILFLYSFKLLNIIPPFLGITYYNQIIPFSFLLLFLSLAQPPVFISSFTAFLGKISYSIYLWHPLVIVSLRDVYPKINALDFGISITFLLCSLLTFVILLPIAYISFEYVEKNGIAAGKYIVNRLSQK